METQDIQQLFQNIDLGRPAKRRKLVSSSPLEPVSWTERVDPGHHSSSKRPREGPSIESVGIPVDQLVPIGVVGFDPLLSYPTILFCDDLFHSDSGLVSIHTKDQFEVPEVARSSSGPPFIFGISWEVVHQSDQYNGFIAFDSLSNLGQLVPWNRRTLDCQISTYLDDILIKFGDKETTKRAKQDDSNSNWIK